jgi:hypothetical protein
MSGSSSFVVQGALASLISAILHAAPLPEDALDRLYRLSIDTVLPAIFAESEQVICCTVYICCACSISRPKYTCDAFILPTGKSQHFRGKNAD